MKTQDSQLNRAGRLPRSPSRTTEWLATFTRVLQSGTADRDLAGMEENDEDDDDSAQEVPKNQQSGRILVRLQQDTVVTVAYTKSSKKLCVLDHLSADEEFERLAERGDAIAIVVAGVCVGWVPSTAVVSSRQEASRVVALSRRETPINGRIRSFKWDRPVSPRMSNQGFRVLFKLLSIIGKPLRCLHLPALKLQSGHLKEILGLCPNLTELNISGHDLVDIQPLEDAYASGKCRIARLSIARSENECSRRGDLTHAITRILDGPGRDVIRRLVMHALPPVRLPERFESSAAWREGVVPLATAVGAAPNLEYFQLTGIIEFGRDAPKLLDIDLPMQPSCVAPMALASKLAFLSVLRGSSSGASQLDALVLSNVFRFSSETVVRRVLLSGRVLMDPCECCPQETK